MKKYIFQWVKRATTIPTRISNISVLHPYTHSNYSSMCRNLPAKYYPSQLCCSSTSPYFDHGHQQRLMGHAADWMSSMEMSLLPCPAGGSGGVLRTRASWLLCLLFLFLYAAAAAATRPRGEIRGSYARLRSLTFSVRQQHIRGGRRRRETAPPLRSGHLLWVRTDRYDKVSNENRLYIRL